jgi:RNA polymerase sigma-70 factor (ECF subfamily)|nr:RNA polymerase sigma factor [Kofleriaceae bacterium]
MTVAMVFAMLALVPDPGDADRDGGTGTGAARPPSGDRDDALVDRHLANDPGAFVEIYRVHAGGVFRRLTRLLGPIPEREDLMQDVFLAVHRALPRFRGDATLATLIHRIAINIACEHLRRRSRRPADPIDPAFFDELVGPMLDPRELTALRGEVVRVFGCLAKIKPNKRVALILHVVEGLSFGAIAELAQCSVDAAAKRVQHAQRELDALLARSARAGGDR